MASLIRVLLAGLISIPLCAQTEIGSASLNGTVTDPSNAVVAGARVSVRDSATGLERTTDTGGAGVYLFKLPVGTYDVTIEAKGFKKAVVKGLQLTVGSAPTLDIALQLGAATEIVDVTADAPAVETTRTASSTSVSARAVADLPVNGRNFIDFTTLTPGRGERPDPLRRPFLRRSARPG